MKTHEKIKITVFFSLFILLYGCGTAHIKTGIQTQDLGEYKNILIQEIKVYSNDDSAKSNIALQKKIKDWESYSRSQFETYANNSKYRLIESLDGVEGKTLVVDLDVNVQYGNRALRYWVGFGAGKGGVHSTLTVKDAKTGKVKFQAQADSDLSMGGGGGDIGEVLKKNVRMIIDQYNKALKGETI